MTAGYSDLLGQQEVLRPLFAAAAADRLHHCYLFEGPPGVGKATAALRLAMAGACTGGGPGLFGDPAPLPCGACDACRLMLAGNHPDLVVVGPDPGSRIGAITVAQAREVVRQAGMRAWSARRRTFVVDPADALVPQAANALLKTLEEPPEGTGFVLVTCRASTLLPTVRSRAQRVRFRAVPTQALQAWLEARGVDDAAAVAREAAGSPGRALELAAEGLGGLQQRRKALLDAARGGPERWAHLSEAITRGDRATWRPRVDELLRSVEVLGAEVAREAASGRPHPLGHLFPGGVRRLDDALSTARDQLEVNVQGRLVVEAFLAAVAREVA